MHFGGREVMCSKEKNGGGKDRFGSEAGGSVGLDILFPIILKPRM